MQGAASANHEELTRAPKLAEFKSHPVAHAHLFGGSALFQRPLERRIETVRPDVNMGQKFRH